MVCNDADKQTMPKQTAIRRKVPSAQRIVCNDVMCQCDIVLPASLTSSGGGDGDPAQGVRHCVSGTKRGEMGWGGRREGRGGEGRGGRGGGGAKAHTYTGSDSRCAHKKERGAGGKGVQACTIVASTCKMIAQQSQE